MPQGFRSPSKIARRLLLTPLASRVVENWSSFMYHYALGLTPAAPYRFRGGQRLHIGRGVDHVPIIEIFLRKDYGDIAANSVIIDLGANIGTFAIYAATSAPNVRVYAYEPMPGFFALMRTNVSLNGLDASVTCFNLAVAADQAERRLFVSGTGSHFPTLVPTPASSPPGSRSGSIPQSIPESIPQSIPQSINVRCVDVATILDANRLSQVDILKMDVEGAEYDILYDMASETLGRIREVRMEYHHLDDDRRNVGSLKRFLTSRRYDITRQEATTSTNGTLWARQHD